MLQRHEHVLCWDCMRITLLTAFVVWAAERAWDFVWTLRLPVWM
jgi:hypothetical protein